MTAALDHGLAAVNYLCATCGVQFAASPAPPATCPICDDERQYVPPGGQRWTTLAHLRAGHRNAFQRLAPDLLGVATTPQFAIGQRAILIQTPAGNYLWDCVSLIDPATVDLLQALGGVRGIALSHPHFYSSMVEWSQALGGVPILLHQADQAWVMRPDPAVKFWDGPTYALAPGLTLIHCGGHFAGSTALHWAAGADGRGALFTGDTLQVAQDQRSVSFMRSYPNLIPLSAAAVAHIAAMVAPFAFERLYGGWWDRVIETNAAAAVQASATRYIAALRGQTWERP